MHPIFSLHGGTVPLLVSIPHSGIAVPDDIGSRMSEAGAAVPDTDWHVDRLYEFAGELGASVIVAHYSRYVVDLNRPPDDEPLYPGQTGTGLVPIDTFDGVGIYDRDITPDMAEVMARTDAFWEPYHQAVKNELERLVANHGHAVLWDAHSISSEVPRLFDGTLPDFNFGTNDGASCDESLIRAIMARAEGATGYSAVLNGRFKGGYITRHFGKPSAGVHAIQLELSQRTYMEEQAPWPYRIDLAAKVRPHLRGFLETCVEWHP